MSNTTLRIQVKIRSLFRCLSQFGGSLVFLFFIPVAVSAQTTLQKGDVVIIGISADSQDEFSWVPLVNLEAGTVIYFADIGSFPGEGDAIGLGKLKNSSSGLIKYTAPAGGITAGTRQSVVDNGSGGFSDEKTSPYSIITSTGLANESDMDLSTGGARILVFQSSDAENANFTTTNFSPIFAATIHSSEWNIPRATPSFNTHTLLYPGLTDGQDAVSAGNDNDDTDGTDSEFDNARYTGSTTSGTRSQILAAIVDDTNWTGTNSTVAAGWTQGGVASNFMVSPDAAAPTSATVAVTAFLEGAWNGTDMNTRLKSGGLMSLTAPYDTINNHNGSESVTAEGDIPADIVDWVLVELREADSPGDANDASRVGSAAGFLKSNGQIVATDGSSDLSISLSGNTGADFFVVVYHRNHLPIMSLAKVSENSGKYTIDLSVAGNVYEAGNAVTTLSPGSKVGMHAGDIDQNGFINDNDLNTWRSSNGVIYSYAGSGKADFNLDGVINAVDRNEFHQKNTAKTRQVPK